MIPQAEAIRQFQAPTTEKLLSRCEMTWRVATAEGVRAIKQDQRSLNVPVWGETQEMVQEAIQILEAKGYGFTYSYRDLTEKELADPDKGWTTGYLVFNW